MLTIANLREYQKRAVDFLLTRNAAGLLLDMGLGKTIITLLAVIGFIREKRAKRFLLVGPIRVIESVWIQEAAKWEMTQKLRILLVRGSPGERDALLRTKAHIYLINPEMVQWLIEWMKVNGCPFDGLIIDESSMFKSSSTKRWKALRLALAMFNVRMILTGTPAPNSLMDLWSQIYLLDQGARLGTAFYRFRDRFFVSDYMGYKWEPRADAHETITKAISDIVLRLDARDYMEIKKPIPNRVEVALPPDVMKQYKRFEREMFIELEETTVESFNAASLTMRCQQIANGALYHLNDAGQRTEEYTVLHDEKVDALREVVDETGSPIIVAFQFQHDRERLQKVYPDAPILGGVQKGKTVDILKAFAEGKIPVLLVNPMSVGHGMNDMETFCHTLAFFSLTWSREKHDQLIARIAGARAAQAGNPHPVVVHYIVAKDTVDEVMLETLRDKGAGQRAHLNALREYQSTHEEMME